MELFARRGYGETTIEEITARAGLTPRTFFNYFADKREVLFAGSEQFVEQVTAGVRSAPRSSAPLDAVLAGYESTSAFFEGRRPFARKRFALISAHPELHERELIKMMSVTAAIVEVLKARGTAPAAASLAAEAGLAVLRAGFEQWVADKKDRDLAFHLRAARRQLEAVIVARPSARR